MGKLKAKDFESIRGLSVDYVSNQFDDGRTHHIDAYVAAADINVGVTIKGNHPHTDEELVLSCVKGNYEKESKYDRSVTDRFVERILSGNYNAIKVRASDEDYFMPGQSGGDAAYMENACPFNK